MSDTPRTDAVIKGAGVWTEQEVLIRHARQLESELAAATNAISDTVNHADMMRDEFKRIAACPGADDEIRGLCQRAIERTNRNVPVLVELDATQAERDRLRRYAVTLEAAVTPLFAHEANDGLGGDQVVIGVCRALRAAIQAHRSATAECKPTNTVCFRCNNDISKCDGAFKRDSSHEISTSSIVTHDILPTVPTCSICGKPCEGTWQGRSNGDGMKAWHTPMCPTSEPVEYDRTIGDPPISSPPIWDGYDAIVAAFHKWLDARPAGYAQACGCTSNPGGSWFDAFAGGVAWKREEQFRLDNSSDLDAQRFRWLSNRFLGADFTYSRDDEGRTRCVLLIEFPEGGKVYGDLAFTVDTERTRPDRPLEQFHASISTNPAAAPLGNEPEGCLSASGAAEGGVQRDEDGYDENFLKACPKCGGQGKAFLLRVICQGCGARTRDFTCTAGEYQREEQMARSAWNRGQLETHQTNCQPKE